LCGIGGELQLRLGGFEFGRQQGAVDQCSGERKARHQKTQRQCEHQCARREWSQRDRARPELRQEPQARRGAECQVQQ
jgi:hypothetical protein